VLAGMAGGPEWVARTEAARPEGERHLAVHEGHVVAVNERDLPLLDVGGEGMLTSGWTGTAEAVRARAEEAAAAGVTEIAYGPAGSDIPRELRAFAAAVRG
jgi:5,10-methylenetetrahydromethanopterin reductase